MKDLIKRIFNGEPGHGIASTLTPGDIAYDRAMKASEEVLVSLRQSRPRTEAARSVMSEIWSQAHNVPFMTTVYEAVQEAKSGPDVVRESRYIPFLVNGHGRRRAP